jgi:hypothetical protein
MAFASFYKFLKEKEHKKYFALTVLFVCLTTLSHLGPLIFIAISFALLIESKNEIKKLLSVGIISTGITAFWFMPFFYFVNLSIVEKQKGMLLTSQGIVASGIFLAFALLAVLFVFMKAKNRHPRIERLIKGSFILSVVILFFPLLPVIEKPFAHSYHAFFVFVLLIAVLILIKENSIKKEHLIFMSIAFIVSLLLAFPVIERQYSFEEPRLKDYKIKDISLLTKEIPGDSRFEVLPFNPVIHSFTALNKKLSLNGWGYNAYTLKESNSIGTKMASMQLPCKEFIEGIKKTATNYWIVTNREGENYVKKCRLKEKTKLKEGFPKLYYFEEYSPLVENGKLIEFSNKKVVIESFGGNVLLKQSFFPGWNAYQHGKKLKTANKKPGIEILNTKEGIIKLKREKTLVEWIGTIISIASIAIFLFLIKTTRLKSSTTS